ncbi:hypothetical protein Tco_1547454 [Tanacetum coccineum]
METKDTLSSCSNSEEQQMQQIQDKAKESCMVSFQQLHSHLKLLSNNNLNGTRTESGFKRAFATLFGQDIETFTGIMFLNVDQLEKQLDKEEFQEIGSMAAFKVLETQFQMFIKSRMYMDDEYVVMTRNYFLQYTQLEIPEFHDTLIQHMESVKKSIDERAKHKQEYTSGNGYPRKGQKSSKNGQNRARNGKAWKSQSQVKAKKSTKEKSKSNPEKSKVKPEAVTQEMLNGPTLLKPRFASQVDVNNDLSKPVTAPYLPKERESVFAKPHHMIAPSSSRYSSNDMVHNHYLEEAKKKTQESGRNSTPSVMPFAKSQCTANGSIPKHRINN